MPHTDTNAVSPRQRAESGPHRRLAPGAAGLTGTRELRQCGLDPLLDRRLRAEADDLIDTLAALEQHQGRDAADAVGRGDLRILIGIELAELDLAFVLAGQF